MLFPMKQWKITAEYPPRHIARRSATYLRIILFSLPGLKVHAKVALVLRRDKQGHKLPSYAYISTGNFNEKTARNM